MRKKYLSIVMLAVFVLAFSLVPADVQAARSEAACTGSDPIPTAKAGRKRMLSGTECDCSD